MTDTTQTAGHNPVLFRAQGILDTLEDVQDSSALRTNVRSLLCLGYRKGSDGILLPKPLRGANGREKCLRSPLVRRLCHHYPRRAETKRRVLTLLNREDWDRLELSIQAVGLTVWTNPLCTPDILKDVGALEAFDSFKLFWVNLALQGCTLRPGESPPYTLPFLQGAIKGLKALAAWAGWYAAADPRNVRPKSLANFPGWDAKRGVNRLTWFGGSLSCLRSPDDPSDEIIAALSQVRTFGRALPPAWGPELLRAGKDQLQVLLEARRTDPEVLDLLYETAMVLGAKLPKVGFQTHTSICKSGSLDVPSIVGGRATELCPATKRLVHSTDEWLRSASGFLPDGQYYDCFGRVLMRVDNGFPQFGSRDLLVPQILVKSIIAEAAKSFRDIPFGKSFHVLALWPEDMPVSFWKSPGSPVSWLNGQLGFFFQQNNIIDLLLRDIGTFDERPDGFLGEHSNVLGLRGPGIPYWRTPGRRNLSSGSAPLDCGYHILGEPGFKARPLTISCGAANCLAQEMRHMVQPSFNADPRLRIGFEETHILWNFLKRLNPIMERKGLKTPLFINSDFKASTDYIPLDVIRHIWDGFLRGQSLRPGHPLMVCWFLIFHPRRLVPADRVSIQLAADPELSGEWIQRRGSNMGEPMSFLTLTLLNLCTIMIAQKTAVIPRPKRFHTELLVDSDMADPLVPCQIVGDDVIAVADDNFYECLRNIVLDVGMKYSDGKNLFSKRLLILCEDVAIFREGKARFVDVVKTRLLTRMTRIHSDNRSAVIGKGAAVSVFTGWNENPWVAYSCRAAYMDTFRKVLTEKKFLGKSFPFELPPIVGGISLPDRKWEQFQEECSFPLRFLRWVLGQPLPTFLSWVHRMSKMSGRRKKGVATDMEPVDIHDALRGYRFAGPDIPLGTRGYVFPRSRILSGLQEAGIEIPRSPYSGQPINAVILSEAEANLSMVPLTKLLDYHDRMSSFSELFLEVAPKPAAKLSFAAYQRSLHKFWKRTVGGLETEGWFAKQDQPLPDDHGFASFDDVHRAFQFRLSSFIKIDPGDLWFLRFGPNLRFSYHN